VEDLGRERLHVLRVALAFVAGLTVVFVLLGAGAGGVGRLLIDYRRELTIVAGVFIALSGLVVAGVLRLPERAAAVAPRPGGAGAAVLTGAAVAIGWTPCVGYVLGGILTMAASSQSAVSGSILLLVYSAGLGVPFVAAALAFGWVSRRLAAVKRHYRVVQLAGGAIFVVFGVLLATGLLQHLSSWLPSFNLGGL
jgi:cytochrome c-type biogenesis protein